jgi:C_GCAxxG_C_C family probable redox protein
MNSTTEYPINAKKEFRECGTCSRTFAHILNTEFGHPLEDEEKATDQLAGGVMNSGHQCGMLWGAVLAVGVESFQMYRDTDLATASAIEATQEILKSFSDETGTPNCQEIIGYNLSSRWGLLKYMIKVTLQGLNNSQCFNLAEKWAPDAILSAKKGLRTQSLPFKKDVLSCASEIVKAMGGSEEEAAMVTGFAGGMGLSGNACGALSAAIWFRSLGWCRENPGKTPPYFNNPVTKNILKAFYEETDGEMRCDIITGRSFKSLDEHSEYIKNEGCDRLRKVLQTS